MDYDSYTAVRLDVDGIELLLLGLPEVQAALTLASWRRVGSS